MRLKQYKIISIIAIAIGLAMIAATLLYFEAMPQGQKIVFVVCVVLLIGAMVYNLKMIRRKEKEAKNKKAESNEEK